MMTSGCTAKKSFTMLLKSARSRLCVTIAAGVASSISVLVTTPTDMPRRRLTSSEIVSTFG